MRYTRIDLDKDLGDINHKLWILNARHRLVTERRNGYVAIDLATVEQLERQLTSRTLASGTPRECLAAANAYVVRHVYAPDLKQARFHTMTID